MAFFDIGPFARGVARPAAAEALDARSCRACSDFYPPPERARIQHVRQAARFAGSSRRRGPCRTSDVYLAFARFPLRDGLPDAATGRRRSSCEDLRFLPWFTGPWERDGEAGHPAAALRLPRAARRGATAGLSAGFVRSGRRGPERDGAAAPAT